MRSIDDDGVRYYDEHRNLHRDGAPAEILDNGSILFYDHGKLHRIDGPAMVSPLGGIRYFENGELHRIGGPAIDDNYGKKYWFIRGVKYSEEDYLKQMETQEILISGKIFQLVPVED